MDCNFELTPCSSRASFFSNHHLDHRGGDPHGHPFFRPTANRPSSAFSYQAFIDENEDFCCYNCNDFDSRPQSAFSEPPVVTFAESCYHGPTCRPSEDHDVSVHENDHAKITTKRVGAGGRVVNKKRCTFIPSYTDALCLVSRNLRRRNAATVSSNLLNLESTSSPYLGSTHNRIRCSSPSPKIQTSYFASGQHHLMPVGTMTSDHQDQRHMFPVTHLPPKYSPHNIKPSARVHHSNVLAKYTKSIYEKQPIFQEFANKIPAVKKNLYNADSISSLKNDFHHLISSDDNEKNTRQPFSGKERPVASTNTENVTYPWQQGLTQGVEDVRHPWSEWKSKTLLSKHSRAADQFRKEQRVKFDASPNRIRIYHPSTWSRRCS